MTNEIRYHILPHSSLLWKEQRDETEFLEYVYNRFLKEGRLEK
jgi:hypothetical protein